MAEFQEVAKAYVRMCDSHSTCEGCPIQAPGNDIDSCRCCVFKWPEKYESKIMQWAAEHPEPVYPTWIEWFQRHVWIKGTDDSSMFLYEPIPADIAEKLGLQPKK